MENDGFEKIEFFSLLNIFRYENWHCHIFTWRFADDPEVNWGTHKNLSKCEIFTICTYVQGWGQRYVVYMPHIDPLWSCPR